MSWGSKKQVSVALSSCEAEIYALSEAAKDVVYFRKFVTGLDPEAVKGSTMLGTDNKSARDLSYNPEHHNKTKHIARRHFFVRDMVEAFELHVPFVPTADNVADMFTKPMVMAGVRVALTPKVADRALSLVVFSSRCSLSTPSSLGTEKVIWTTTLPPPMVMIKSDVGTP